MPKIITKNILSSKKYLTCKYPFTINSVNAAATVATSLSVGPYITIAQALAQIPTFTSQIARYGLWRITGVKLDVQRIITETEISLVYTNGVMPTIFCMFSPGTTGTSSGISSQNLSNSVEVDGLLTERQRMNFLFPPLFAYSSSGTSSGSQHMYGMWNVLNTNYTNIPGEIVVQTNNSTLASSANPLYTATIYIDVEFAQDIA